MVSTKTLLLKGDSFSWYRDVFFGVSRFFDLLFGIEIFFDLQCTGCRGPKNTHTHTHRLIPGRRRSQCRTAECRISIPKKRSQYQKGDLGHLNTTKKTSRYQKKDAPITKALLPWSRTSCQQKAKENISPTDEFLQGGQGQLLGTGAQRALQGILMPRGKN